MKETKDVTFLVYDHGMVGVPMAERLSRQMKHGYVFTEWEKGFSSINDYVTGNGFENFDRCDDIWEVLDEVDLFVFPDIQHSGLQLHLEKMGKAVWGSRKGDQQEQNRELFLKTLKDKGMDVPLHEVVVGIDALRTYLKGKEDYYIKVSTFRGSFETSHWRNWKQDNGMLDLWSVRFGPCKDMIRFLVFPNIDTPLEIGADTYCVDGQWPSKMLHGVEWKDRSYFGSVMETQSMPRQIRQVLTSFGPVLGKDHYRNQFSMEVRVKGNKSYFIDATCRMGLPSTGSQLEMWKNWPDIVWKGANGQLVEPIPTGKFCAEAIVTLKGDPQEWRTVEIDPELKRWLKLADCCEVDGMTVFPAGETGNQDEVGWLVAIGNTPEETVKKLNSQADSLPDGMDANTECVAYVLKEIQQEEKQGIKFSDMKMPKPGFVMES